MSSRAGPSSSLTPWVFDSVADSIDMPLPRLRSADDDPPDV